LADQPEGRLSAEAVARYPVPGTDAPAAGAFSPDGRWVAYLWSPEHSLRRDLFVLDLETGTTTAPLAARGGAGVTEENLTLEERLRRERSRNLGQGVTSLSWAKGGPTARLLVPQQDGLHVLDAPAFEDRLAVAATGSPMLDPQLSPDGTRVAFVLDDELCVASLADGAVATVTSGARGTGRTHGLAEFAAQEEMGRFHGFWWSPDGTRLAYTEVDETHIPIYRIVHQGSDAVGEGAEEDHRYPFAGGANARVGLFVVVAAGGQPVEMDLGAGWEYLGRVDWLDEDVLTAQLEDRAQRRLDLVALDPATGVRHGLVTEESDVWINLHDVLRPVPSTDTFLWASEHSGFRHLETRSIADGSLLQVLTDGDWLVERVVHVSPTTVWFVGTRDSPLERHLYEVPTAGGDVRRVTGESGTHAVAAVDADRGRFVDVWSSLSQPAMARVCSLADGSVQRPLLPADAAVDPRLGELALDPPETTTVTTDDGETLHVLVYRPDVEEFGDGPYPTVVSVYGGPHAQMVTDAWTSTASMRRQWLRSFGFLVVVADNRGSAGRGLAFEGRLRWDLGSIEVDDQVAVVRELAHRRLVDPERVAINGWSYGGYMSALCLAKRPDVFRAAVAGAPVTAWDGYDTHYTERYMGTPAENADGYARSQVMAHVGGLRDRSLLLVHGLIDENVHFRHTARLINALIRAGIRYNLLLFPDERHSPRSLADRVFMEERIRDFLVEALA
jgi:dipeptidyl-peptidase-4